MTKKEVMEALKDIDDNDEVVVFWSHNGHATLEGILCASLNGNCIQLNCESLSEDPQWIKAHQVPNAN